MTTDAPCHLEEGVNLLLLRLNVAMRKRLDMKLRPHGLNSTSLCILSAVAGGRAESQADLIRCIGIDRAAVCRSIQALEKRGLVSRSGCPDDKRVGNLTVTAEGRRLLPQLVAESEEVNEAFFGHLPRAKQEQLTQTLRDVYTRVCGEKAPDEGEDVDCE